MPYQVLTAGPTPRVGEISIRGYIGVSHGGQPWPSPWGPVGTPASAVLADLARLRESGASVLLVRLESPGGLVADSLVIADALREWSKERGPVVVHLTGEVCSVAPVIAAAGDLVLMDPAAAIWLHSMTGPAAEAANAEMLRRLSVRCTSPDLPAWLALGNNDRGEPNRAELDAEAAVSHGLASCIGSLEEARTLAARFVPGGPFRFSPAPIALAPFVGEAFGAKLDHSGVALKVAAGNFQIGSKLLSEADVDLFSFGAANHGFLRAAGPNSYAAGSAAWFRLSTFGLYRTSQVVQGSVTLGSTGCSLKVTTAGTYLVHYRVGITDSGSSAGNFQTSVFKNGSQVTDTTIANYRPAVAAPYVQMSDMVSLALAANDEVEVAAYLLSGPTSYAREHSLFVQRLK